LAVYVAIGLGAGMLGGAFLDRIGAERYLMPVGQAVMKNAGEGKGAIPASGESDTEESKSGDKPDRFESKIFHRLPESVGFCRG
jgi:hypothetical protein